YVCFFFSSRRRHTRCYRDWSSDVCSSDLQLSIANNFVRTGGRQRRVTIGTYPAISLAEAREEARKIIRNAQLGVLDEPARITKRSEERRVGKECRDRRRVES